MDSNDNTLTGEIDFEELVNEFDLSLIAVDPDWTIQYHNKSSTELLDANNSIGRSFWESLNNDFKTCFSKAYKRALLGNQDQLNVNGESQNNKQNPLDVFEDLQLNMLDQKDTIFQFQCEENNTAYTVSIDIHEGFYILRIEDITDRIKARIRAERNKQELQEALREIKEAREANPLTGLPGNIRIEKTLQAYLDRDIDFALIYADIDNFKSFNDRYGFDRGDEAILLLKDILRESMEEYPSDINFLGHVGGDDFIMTVDPNDYEELCELIIEKFDNQVTQLYDDEDREKGGIVIENRQGETERFGFMTLTLAVVTTLQRSFDKYLAMTETAAELKSHAKQKMDESTYFVERRRD